MAAGDGAQLPATVAASRSVEKALEDAAASGALNLANRKLKEFPRSARNYDLSDITHADLSKNRLCELPEELGQFISLETLSLYHNGMRSLSSCLGNLQALTYLNLSRNLLSSLSPSVFELPLLRVLIISNNKLSSLPTSIFSLAHLRQLDVSCNELQCLPAELCQLECLRDLNLRRNQLTTLPEEISELPLVRLDVSCNRITQVPLCYRHMRHLQSILLDSNPLQMPPAQICSKGKYHIFKYLNMEACKRSQEELERHLRPTAFNSCLSDQELFTSQFGGLDSGFNSVDSGSKRWSGNESADDFSERSLRMSEVSRDQRNLEEEKEEEEDVSLLESNKVNGQAEKMDFIDSSVTEEEDDEMKTDPPTPPPEVHPQRLRERVSPSHNNDSTICRATVQVEVVLPSSPSPLSPSPLSPSSPTMEERRRPGTLLIWQERERQQQQQQGEKASLLKALNKTGSLVAYAPPTGSCSDGTLPVSSASHRGSRPRCASTEHIVCSSSTLLIQRSRSRTEGPSSPKTSPPPAQNQKPNSFLFRTSSRSNVRPTGLSSSESHATVRSPKEERAEVMQLRKTLETRLKITLPEDLGEALSNGTVLCQLVNSIRARSVSIIHIPSPAVPKLSSAKCRLNVEHFLVACRKLGVPEMDMCVCSDVLLSKLPNVLQCVKALLALQEEGPADDRPLKHSLPSSSSLLSTDFLLFYCVAMVLLYALYCYLLT
ncbi:leucine-rich repeat and calponin homology domain-containing protein 4 isoform X1 [Dunckerocampus dactyliophorus]|uniref:leucine-rich repeat and calponin homology domain-containing protein 4 isoform X1 n=1 Tax=Dunckerocampus dactyliophorus TaxID=161453 RepID=UPI00240595F6|nr:leucine-rich repeat and calponin homology domain-containing protein 4 isoform X1 [Dunckerocampus dactyliophorus]